MAINPTTAFPGKIAAATADYPFGEAQDITVPNDGTGTPWKAILLNDIFGFQQAILSEAGAAPTGTPDKVGASQYLDGIYQLSGLRTFASLAAAAATDLTRFDKIVTASYLPNWEDTLEGPKGAALYHSDNTTGTPGAIYPNRDGFFDSTGKGFLLSKNQELTPYIFGAVGDGTAAPGGTDDTTALLAWYATCKARGVTAYGGEGKFRHTVQLLWDGEIGVIGAGGGENSTQGTQFIKDGNFTGIFISNSEGSEFAHFRAAGAIGNGGKGVDIYLGNGSKIHDMYINEHAGIGMHVRAGNRGSYYNLKTISNGDAGLQWSSGTGFGFANELGEGSGAPQSAQACTCWNLDIRGNNISLGTAAFLIEIGNTNLFMGVICQNNVQKSLQVNAGISSIIMDGFYDEFAGVVSTSAGTGNTFRVMEGSLDVSSSVGDVVDDYNQAGTKRYGHNNVNTSKLTLEDREQHNGAHDNPNAWTFEELGTIAGHLMNITDQGSAALPGLIAIAHNGANTVSMTLDGNLTLGEDLVCDVFGNNAVVTLANEATPTVAESNTFVTGGTTTITTFDDGKDGQLIAITAAHTVTLTHSVNLNLDNAVDFDMSPGDTIFLYPSASNTWQELGRKLGTLAKNATTAQFIDQTAVINTLNKFVGRVAFNSDTNLLLTAGGPLATDHWFSAAGVDTHTPV